MTNEKIISESQNLYSDIDYCIIELLKARTEHNSENEGKALLKMEGLMVATMQHLGCVIDFLKEQEQPEMDLDSLMEEIKRYYSDNYAYITSDQPTLSILTNIARHFYELGLNTRKEETK